MPKAANTKVIKSTQTIIKTTTQIQVKPAYIPKKNNQTLSKAKPVISKKQGSM